MATVHYPAIVERAGTGYSVYFPDLAGCTSAGDTLQDAAIGAEEALSGHLAVSSEHGDDIPAPSDLDAIARDPEVEEVVRLLVRGERPGRALRVQISMDEALLARIDRVADNRSAFLADAARVALRQMLRPEAGIFDADPAPGLLETVVGVPPKPKSRSARPARAAKAGA